MEPVQPVQMNIYQSNTYKKDFSWVHFKYEPMVQERQQVKDQQYCISISVAYSTIPSRNYEHHPRHDDSIPYMAVVDLYRYTALSRERNFIEQIKAPIFLETDLAIVIM